MGVMRTSVRILISLIGAVLPLLFLSGSYSPLNSLLQNLPNFLGKDSTLYTSLQNSFGTALPVGVLPFGTAGITGVAVYSVLQRVMGSLKMATYSQPKIDTSQMLRSLQGQMNFANMRQISMPDLPKDMSKAQYLILSSYRQGQKNPKNIAKMLSMDKKSVVEQTRMLQTNGYLTRNNKLTTKGLENLP
jgi:hypothetical protein